MKILIKLNLIILLLVTNSYGKTAFLNTTSNIRHEPSLKAKINVILQKGSIVDVLKKITTKHNGTWYKTNKGYIYSKLLNFPNHKNNNYIFVAKKVNIYNNTNKSKIISHTKAKSYYKVLEEKVLKNNIYPWYRIKQGWVTNPYLELNEKRTNTTNTKKKIKEKNSTKKIVSSVKNIKSDKKTITLIKNNKANKKLINLIENNKSEKIISKTKKVETKVLKAKDNFVYKKREYNSFFGVSIGYSYMDSEKVNVIGDISLNEEIDKTGLNLNIEAGMRFDDNFYTINYTNVKYSDVDFNRFLLSANKSFKNIKFNPYIGLIGGFSYIELTKAHFNTQIPKAIGLDYAYGVTTGLEYKISKRLSLNPYFRYLRATHTTQLKSNPALVQINRYNHIDFNIGLRYDIY